MSGRLARHGHASSLSTFAVPSDSRNDKWWGTGSHRMDECRKARRSFAVTTSREFQGIWGSYDLRLPETRAARRNWRDRPGSRILLLALLVRGRDYREAILRSPDERRARFPVLSRMANQTWSGIWYDAPNRILISRPIRRPGP
jgi:hypothetical protein